jgi:SSS family solute:Na+ symporter
MSLSTILVKNGMDPSLANPLHTNMTIVIGTAVVFLVGFGLGGLVKRK